MHRFSVVPALKPRSKHLSLRKFYHYVCIRYECLRNSSPICCAGVHLGTAWERCAWIAPRMPYKNPRSLAAQLSRKRGNERWRRKHRAQYNNLHKITNRRWREANRERYRSSARRCAQNLKYAAMSFYSRSAIPFCNCCGETLPEFLTIHHINNNGAAHRRKDKSANTIYRWLKQHNYPPGFSVLCWNCNTAMGYFGYCPHILVLS